MKLTDLIRANEALELKVGRIQTKTVVREVLGEKLLIVDQPEYRLRPLIIAADERVKLSAFRINGVFTLNAAVEETFTRDGASQCLLRVTGEVEREQRRYFYRLPVKLSVMVRPKGREQSKIAMGYPAETINLSERGVCFSCRERLPRGKRISVQMELDDMGFMVLSAEVLRCEPLAKKEGAYVIGAQFTELTGAESAYIRKFIMKRQMKRPEREEG
ncbi:MAG TPA: PilZ domain-containing protein [Clostridia bacterium]|nr:PilZ domain-containing protein [Clostridia bacterium]